MTNPKPYRRRTHEKSQKPHRDWFDKATLVIAILGVLIVVTSTVLSQINQTSSNADMARALNSMAVIANSSAGQEQATQNQAAATTNAARETAASAEATKQTAISTQALARNSGLQIGALQTSADAAKAQADASKQQATAALAASGATDRLARSGANQVEALLASDRPWAGTSLPTAGQPVAGQEWIITVPMINTGRSPALQLRGQMLPTYIVQGTHYSFSNLNECAPRVCAMSTVFPGSNTAFTEKVPKEQMTEAFVTALKSDRPAIFIQTRTDYADPNGRKHHSFGCYYYNSQIGFTNCTVGNDAD